MFEKKKLLGVGITIATKEEVLKYIITGLQKSAKKYYVVTPNPEILVLAHKDPVYKKCLNEADLALPDGMGVLIGGYLLGIRLKERIPGVDLMENLCKEVADKPVTTGFLGAGPGVAEKAAECLIKKYSGLKISYVSEEWNGEKITKSTHEKLLRSSQKDSSNSKLLAEERIDILFVAFGSPKQELWIAQNLENLPAKVIIGVGGAFDFVSGKVRRAPVWIRKIGLEWFFRLIVQPWRIKRQLRLIEFVLLVITEKFGKKTS